MRGITIELMGGVKTQSGSIEFLFWIANCILVDVKRMLTGRKPIHGEIEFYAARRHWREHSVAHEFAFTILDSHCERRRTRIVRGRLCEKSCAQVD
jgi:hypothetical protein